MPGDRWETPVEFHLGEQGMKSVRSPFEALAYLNDGWPHMAGVQFIQARSKCRASLAGRISAEEARVQFVSAVREANLSVKH